MKPPPKATKKRAPRPVFADDYQMMAESLRAAVKESGVSQLEIAERLSKTPSYLSKVLNGRQVMTLTEVRAICEAAGVPFVEWVQRLDATLKR